MIFNGYFPACVLKFVYKLKVYIFHWTIIVACLTTIHTPSVPTSEITRSRLHKNNNNNKNDTKTQKNPISV